MGKLKFTGEFQKLKDLLKTIGGIWEDSEPTKKVLRINDNGVLNWYVTTGTIQIQGSGSGKNILESKVPNLLYPSEFESFDILLEKNEPHKEVISNNMEEGERYLRSGLNNSEIVIALVNPVGTEYNRITGALKDRIQAFGYILEEIRVSDLLKQFDNELKDKVGNEYKRIKHFMHIGNKLRKTSSNNAILASGISEAIHNLRKNNSHDKRAYLINSLKHPAEVEFLRKLYGVGFFLMGIHADEVKRLKYLTEDKRCKQNEAIELIKIDEDENISHGQRTRDTFYLSDFFINLGNNDDQVKNALQRFLDLIFSHPYQNPTFDEFAMFMAFNSAIRSSDLSRQVGAVITKNQQIIATGANDCPKFGGGQYWATLNIKSNKIEDYIDGKDYTRGQDSNKIAQNEIVNEIANVLVASNLTSNENKDAIIKLLKESKISDLTEFGRVVHAEMEALLSCGRIGVPTTGTTLYCTTFPCHNCAKHIVDAGVYRVVYVEPYPKSKALEFHSESILLKTTYENESSEQKHVIFEPFTGVNARRFLDLFSMNAGFGNKLKRKNSTGHTLEWEKETAPIRTPLLSISYLDIEQSAIKIWKSETSKL